MQEVQLWQDHRNRSGNIKLLCRSYAGGKPTIIPSAEGTTMYGKTVPSVVAFTKDGQILVGEPARRQAAMNPKEL